MRAVRFVLRSAAHVIAGAKYHDSTFRSSVRDIVHALLLPYCYLEECDTGQGSCACWVCV